MAHQLRAFTTLAKDSAQLPVPISVSSHSLTPVPEDLMLSSGFCRHPPHMANAHTNAGTGTQK